MAQKQQSEQQATANPQAGLRINRRFSQDGQNVYDRFEYERRSSVIRNPNGETVFELNNVEAPKQWSQVATDILAQKYFRKAGVPQDDGSEGAEHSIKQVVHRLVDCWRHWGQQYGYFASEADAQVFYDELAYMLLSQMAAPNSPQWFNTGLHHAYGIDGPPQGHSYADPETGEIKQSTSAYERPQPHACFILSVDDDLVNPGGIMDLWVREARIFKYGSGVGTNFSNIRSENEILSGGGYSSGLMSFLRVGDRAAGAIKSGGTTRRAAKMVILDMDHPEIENFINWKVEEEEKVAALMREGYSADYEGEAYNTVSGQNSNNSVRVGNDFMHALARGEDWNTIERTSGQAAETFRAQELWDKIAQAAWRCADPGVQYHSTINEWHTCPQDGPIRGSNPCSEYMFLDNTACNLASLNLRKFFDEEKLSFHVEDFEHAARLWTIVLEISVLMAQYPAEDIARLSDEFRTLGLGYANLGSVLMIAGIPYDSPEARAMAGAISSLMTGKAYETSAEMAAVKGPFKGFERNREDMLRVIRNHRYASYNVSEDTYEGLEVKPMGIDPNYCPQNLLQAACNTWDRALQKGEQYGYRNAQASVLAPTGTIGLLMDCDTTGVEPDFALVKFKKLSGGGYFKIINQSIPPALRNLGYTEAQINDIIHYVKGHTTLEGAPYINAQTLKAKGLNDRDIQKIEQSLDAAFDIRFSFNPFTLGQEAMQRLGFSADEAMRMDINLLAELGFSEQEIESANEYICGTMSIEGAPHLLEAHYPVFDCANRCGKYGKRFIAPEGHIRMMAAAQPFISGAISKTINLPNEASWEDIQDCYKLGWELGVKALSIYRDGSKLSQPLSSVKTAEDEEDEEEQATAQAEAGQQPASTIADSETARKVIELSQEQLLAEVQKILKDEEDTEQFHKQLKRIVNRRELPNRRRGITQKSKVGGQTIFVRTGEYEDGSLGEIFVDMHKEGATMRSLLNCFAISVSIGLQYGVPLEEFVDKFAFTRFEPAGQVFLHDNIKSATSIVDYIFRHLAMLYLDRDDLVQIPPAKDVGTPQPGDTAAEPGQQLAPNNGGPSNASAANSPAPRGTNGHSAEAKSGEQATSQQNLMSSLMGDAPGCDVCGHITVRSGTCYKCLNCGNSMGCS